MTEAQLREYLDNRDRSCWDEVLSTEAGRYVINYILENFSKPFQMSFNSNSVRLTDFREGERNVGNAILAHAFVDRDDLFIKMRQEHVKRMESDKRTMQGINSTEEEYYYDE